MFERFTARARRVLVLAQEEARLLGHSFIGTEHLLLGIIREGEGIGAQALHSLGITLEAAREKVQETIGMSGTIASGSPPFTPRAKKVLELALREALQLQHGYIGTEHLLLGLIREGEGVACAVLVSSGADLGRVRQSVISLMSGGHEEHTTTGSGGSVQQLEMAGGSLVSAGPGAPACPHCLAGVREAALFRTIAVPREDGEGDPVPIDVVYCGQCGATLQLFRAEEPT